MSGPVSSKVCPMSECPTFRLVVRYVRCPTFRLVVRYVRCPQHRSDNVVAAIRLFASGKGVNGFFDEVVAAIKVVDR